MNTENVEEYAQIFLAGGNAMRSAVVEVLRTMSLEGADVLAAESQEVLKAVAEAIAKISFQFEVGNIQ